MVALQEVKMKRMHAPIALQGAIAIILHWIPLNFVPSVGLVNTVWKMAIAIQIDA